MIATLETPLTLPQTTGARTDLDRLTRRQAANEQALATAIAELRAAVAQVQRKHLPRLKRLAAVCAAGDADLRQAVEQARPLFQYRKTMVLNGIKVGLRATPGSLVMDDPDATVRLIEALFPERAEMLIATERSPKIAVIKATVAEADWDKIGCRLEAAGEQVVVSRPGSETERTIATLIRQDGGNVGNRQSGSSLGS